MESQKNNQNLKKDDHNDDCSQNLAPVKVIDVFLGGDCGPNNWRKKATLFLKDNGLTWFDPKVKKWTSKSVEIEATAKEEADVLLFYISPFSRCITSMLEVAEYAMTEKKIVVVIEDIPNDTFIKNIKIEETELKILNDARQFLRCYLERHQRQWFDTIDNALKSIVALSSLQTKSINHIKPKFAYETGGILYHIKPDNHPIIEMIKAIEDCMVGGEVVVKFDDNKDGKNLREPFLLDFGHSREYFEDILKRESCQVVDKSDLS